MCLIGMTMIFLYLQFKGLSLLLAESPINFKMLHTNQAELNQLYGTFCRVWAAGGQATLTTTSLGGKVTAKLEQ